MIALTNLSDTISVISAQPFCFCNFVCCYLVLLFNLISLPCSLALCTVSLLCYLMHFSLVNDLNHYHVPLLNILLRDFILSEILFFKQILGWKEIIYLAQVTELLGPDFAEVVTAILLFVITGCGTCVVLLKISSVEKRDWFQSLWHYHTDTICSILIPIKRDIQKFIMP